MNDYKEPLHLLWNENLNISDKINEKNGIQYAAMWNDFKGKHDMVVSSNTCI